MKVIVAIDNRNGMLFNGRRQSQDRKLREYILTIVGSNKLWMNEYSFKQFENIKNNSIMVDKNYLEKAETDDYCFVESSTIQQYEGRIKEIILCKWNRNYPSDFFLNLDLSHKKLLSVKEFQGYSHEKITVEVYQYAKDN